MKKGLLSALVLLVLTATIANAAPRFGLSMDNAIGTNAGTQLGTGLYITDDMYTAGLGFSSSVSFSRFVSCTGPS